MPEPKARSRSKPPSLKIDSGESSKPRKRSLILSVENDRRLSILAALRDSDRSTLANQLLDVALSGVRGYAPGCEPAQEKYVG